MGRRTPLDSSEYELGETVLRRVEEAGSAIATEHGVRAMVEHNRVETGRGGKFPYLTFRVIGRAEHEPGSFVCSMCGDPATTTGSDGEPRCDEHEEAAA
jgi:hypothetical protein